MWYLVERYATAAAVADANLEAGFAFTRIIPAVAFAATALPRSGRELEVNDV